MMSETGMEYVQRICDKMGWTWRFKNKNFIIEVKRDYKVRR